MRLIKRHEVYAWFLLANDFTHGPFSQMIFTGVSDLDLCKMYRLTYLRPGYFY